MTAWELVVLLFKALPAAKELKDMTGTQIAAVALVVLCALGGVALVLLALSNFPSPLQYLLGGCVAVAVAVDAWKVLRKYAG
jgi:hypothetical protein